MDGVDRHLASVESAAPQREGLSGGKWIESTVILHRLRVRLHKGRDCLEGSGMESTVILHRLRVRLHKGRDCLEGSGMESTVILHRLRVRLHKGRDCLEGSGWSRPSSCIGRECGSTKGGTVWREVDGVDRHLASVESAAPQREGLSGGKWMESTVILHRLRVRLHKGRDCLEGSGWSRPSSCIG